MIITTTKNTPVPIPALRPDVQSDYEFNEFVLSLNEHGGTITAKNSMGAERTCHVAAIDPFLRDGV